MVAGVKGDAPFQVGNNLKDFAITCYSRLTQLQIGCIMVVICYEEEEREGVRMSVQIGKMGYLVELKKKNGFFEEYGELQRILMSGQRLAEILTKKATYFVISAVSVNITEYQLNHDEKLEEWD